MAQWMRVLDTVSGLAQLTERFRRPASRDIGPALPSGGALGAIEARLAGVLVAALKEAFDRDSTRLEMERSQIEAERQRAEEALRAELRRQAGERALDQLRLIALMAIGVWALSAALSVWLPGMRAGVPRGLLGVGWALALGALATSLAAWQRVSAWTAETRQTDRRRGGFRAGQRGRRRAVAPHRRPRPDRRQPAHRAVGRSSPYFSRMQAIGHRPSSSAALTRAAARLRGSLGFAGRRPGRRGV